MKPQDQLWWRGAVLDKSGNETDRGGDCFRACLATILEIDVAFLPNFLKSPSEDYTWWDRWQDYLYGTFRQKLIYWETDWPDVETLAYWIGEVSLPTPHSVVFHKKEFRWDPAPGDRKRIYTVDDIKSVIAIFGIGSIYEDKEAI